MVSSETFSTDKDSIELNGLDTLIKFVHYDTYGNNNFINGIQLSENLTNKFGTILYAKDTPITPNKIDRLKQLIEANPTIDLIFKIKKTAEILGIFRDEIKTQLVTLLNKKGKKDSSFQEFLSTISANFENLLDDFLSEEELTLSLYRMRFICECSDNRSAVAFVEHTLNVALVSIAMGLSAQFSTLIGRDKKKTSELFKTAIFHNYGALIQIDQILEHAQEKRLENYWVSSRVGSNTLDESLLSTDVMKAISLVSDYYFGNRDFIKSNEWSAVMANIIVVADKYLSKERGLFYEAEPQRMIIDRLNVSVAENDIDARAVNALTMGLRMEEIFNFYESLANLTKMCPFKSAVPYPLAGFESPTLYVCSRFITKCPHFESIKAVELLKQLGELKPGQYHRCRILSDKLKSHYQKHYKVIKNSVNYSGVAQKAPEKKPFPTQ